MKIKMRNGNVAIKLSAPQDKTRGGIYVPTTVRQGILQLGRIIAAGPGELVQGQFVEMDLQIEDEVVFDTSHSEPLVIDGETVYICNMVDVVATVSGKYLSVVPKAK